MATSHENDPTVDRIPEPAHISNVVHPISSSSHVYGIIRNATLCHLDAAVAAAAAAALVAQSLYP